MTGINRRTFAESVLTAALVPMLGSAVVPLPADWWASSDAVRGALGPGGDLDTLAEALAGVVRAQYGDRLGPDDLVTVTRQIRSALGRAEQMRAVELANADEPDFVFTAPPPATTR
ncbi:MAG TPA: hypothetical protein VFT84_16730 [Gemmatimonadales bacterium]|nr:hypothetical protein [Gemmatimonadales bacterium]